MDLKATADQEFNLDFSTLENTDVLENFDFDAFLDTRDSPTKFNPNAATADLDAFYTISEDLVGGKQSHKDKALKLLLNRTGLSDFGSKGGVKNAGLGKRNPRFRELDSLAQVEAHEADDRDPSPEFSHVEPTMMDMADNGNTQFAASMSGMSDGGMTPESTQEVNFTAPEQHSNASGKKRVSSAFENHEHRQKRGKMQTAPQNGSPDCAAKEDSELIKVIYMIHCPYKWKNHHRALAFEDVPTSANCTEMKKTSRNDQPDLVHMNGSTPIYDLAAHLKEDDANSTAIVTVRHIRCEENQPGGPTETQASKWHESLAITSSILRQAIADIALCYYDKSEAPNSGNRGIDNQMNRITVSPARLFFFHHHKLLLEYIDNHPHTTNHVLALLQYCKSKFTSDFNDASKMFSEGLVSQKHLDKLFLPNAVVISEVNGHVTGYVVSSWPQFDYSGSLMLCCWAWQNDGTGWVRNLTTLRLPPITSPQTSVQSLGVYPASFASDITKNLLINRGTKLWKLKDTSYISYTGYDTTKEDYYPESRFMVDYTVFKKMHVYAPALSPHVPASFNHDPWPLRLESKESPSEAQLMVLPHIVHGFYLTEKQWIGLYVDGVSTIKWNKTAYERLVIPAKNKELIRALVAVRTSQRGIKHGLGVAGKRVDIIAGKGNGLIMLLHGAPGTGKSLTAESVAEIAEMPLYRVTCGDIGTTPEAVEKYMSIVMHLGVTWNCVLLLDEADVFLEERSMSDLARNSLVSVFLRILEYYDGILILTSNRIGTFDEAFKSRIQVALHYEKLTMSSRKKIWTNFLDMLEEDEEDVNFQEIRFKLDHLAKFDLNGRQIRNAMTTARQLAIFQGTRLDWPHIDQAISVSTEFNEYILRMQGHTDDQKARDDKVR